MRTATHAEDYPIHSVIPAQAGIQAALADICEAGLDSRLRGNDELIGCNQAFRSLDSRLRGNDELIGCDQAFRRLDSRLRGNDAVEHEALLPESNSQEDSANV